jgi:hypothetical protein
VIYLLSSKPAIEENTKTLNRSLNVKLLLKSALCARVKGGNLFDPNFSKAPTTAMQRQIFPNYGRASRKNWLSLEAFTAWEVPVTFGTGE